MVKEKQDLAPYYFHQGTNFRAYDYLGVTCVQTDGQSVYTFRTWAPGADAVALVADFTGWDTPLPMTRVTEGGVWEVSYVSRGSLERCAYKFRLTRGGRTFDKGDPYARFSRGVDDGASLIYTAQTHIWQDAAWLRHRERTVAAQGTDYMCTPVNIYEMHAGSFLRHEEDNRPYSYRELAEVLPSYLTYMGYTHVELLPLSEYPYDGSWGYQVGAFYAPTSRYGEPDDLRYLIDTLHGAGIGVILDWVPAHFPKDAWGLYEFDGGPLYEYQGQDRQESHSWGTRFFDVGREEVQSFLISNALYFLREFHVDGLRVDAVASMLYLDYDRRPGEWYPNPDGTNINREAVAFFQKLNTAVFAEQPSVLMIAEESTAFAGITHPVAEGGLGFNLKWNMGWANDFYDYLATDPLYRRYRHEALNFPLMYAFGENYVLPISHDEVVHGKLSFINKMFGSYEDKFSQTRTALLLQMTYPGKKLLFMGTEYGQFREWDYENALEWFMLDYPKHRALREYTAALNRFYLSRPELWELDFSQEGFQWLLADERDKNAVAFRRVDRHGNALTVLLSFSGAPQTLTIPAQKRGYRCLFTSLQEGVFPPEAMTVVRSGRRYVAQITLPPFGGVVLSDIRTSKKITLKENENVL